ncbi:MAG: hypothetical protein ACXAC5_02060 [Promethearchaeota archaeon]|jgi:hypothetical protein
MNKPTVTIEFPSEEAREGFLGWFLDGGGEDEMQEWMGAHGSDLALSTVDHESKTITFKEG